MPPNAFIGQPAAPTPVELAAALGTAKPAWDQLLADLAETCDASTHEWKCHSPKWGWSLRVLRKKRTIVWLSPATASINVAFILGDRALAAANAAK